MAGIILDAISTLITPSLFVSGAVVSLLLLITVLGLDDHWVRLVASFTVPNRSKKTGRSVGWVNPVKLLSGHLNLLQVDPIGFAKRELEGEGADRAATTMYFPLCAMAACHIMDPKLAKVALNAKFTMRDSTRNIMLPTWHLLFGRGLFMVDGETWKRQHRIAIRSFGSSQTEAFRPIVQAITKDFIDRLPATLGLGSDGAAEFFPEKHFAGLALSIICTIAFGNGGGDEEGRRGVAMMTQAFDDNWAYQTRFGALTVVPGFIHLPTKANREMKANIERMHSVCRRLVTEYRSTGKTGQMEGTSLLKVLCDAADGSDVLSNEEVVHNVFSFMAAGMDTTSTTLAHLVCCLASHPRVQDKLAREMASYEGKGTGQGEGKGEGGSGDDFDLAGALENQYLGYVIKECMRLFPALLGSAPRMAKADTVLGEGAGAGNERATADAVRIRKGQAVVVSNLLMHRNPNVWGKDASEFRPERHDSPSALEKDALRFVSGDYDFTSFGGGVRPCIGRHLSLLELRMATALLVRRFEFVHTEAGRKRVDPTDGAHPCIAVFPIIKVDKSFPVGIKLRQRS